jgi:transposase InsO family protein
MPWKELRPMDQKIGLISDWKKEGYGKTELSKKYGISRKTVYKWINRYEQNSIEGLKEKSRVPHNSPNATPEEKVRLIIAEKLKNRKRGPKKIYWQLKKRHGDIDWPSISTIGNWLKKQGLVEKRKKRIRVPGYTEPFVACKAANDVWSVDYKGQFYMGNGRACYPLTISDNYSRYLLKCKGLAGPRYKPTREAFEDVFRENGLPGALRYDNGTPFAGKGIGGLSRLSIWWIQLGIVPERIEKGCPEQNGRHERMHRTLKEEVLSNIARGMKEQQERFDVFRIDYNGYRPHESLGQEVPDEHYKKSTRPYVERPKVPAYDLCYKVRNVRYNGEIKFGGHLYYLSQLLAGEPVGLKEIGDGFWRIYYSFYGLGTIDLRLGKVIK